MLPMWLALIRQHGEIYSPMSVMGWRWSFWRSLTNALGTRQVSAEARQLPIRQKPYLALLSSSKNSCCVNISHAETTSSSRLVTDFEARMFYA